MLIETVFILLSAIVLLFASITDLKTREIPDSLSYGFIISVLGISFLYSFHTTFLFFGKALLASALVFSTGFVLYRAKQIGGGDVKLLTGLAGVFANFSIFNFPLLSVFGLLLIILGGIYTLAWAIVLYIKNHKRANKEFKAVLEKRKNFRRIVFAIACMAALTSLLVSATEIKIIFAAAALMFLVSFHVFVFTQGIETLHFRKKLAVNQLTEGDWLAQDVKVNNKLICSAKNPGLEKKDIEQLKKYKVTKVLVKVGIPFVPAIALASLATLLLYFLL